MTAARICIHNPHSRYFDQNFEDEVLAHTSSSETFPWNKHMLNAVSHTVSDLFMSSHSNELRVSFEKKEADKLYFIPYVDDRMFCMSLISDGTIYPHKSIDYKSIDSLGDRKRLEELYEFVFIDPSNGCTCQNLPMCKEMLEKALYLRWVDYGTIFGINRYSMVAITGSHEAVGDSVIQPFLTNYKEIVQIVLVQRAAISMFAERAMEISRIASDNKLIKNYMMELHQDYVSFKNQILLFEVTSQQQGIEIYDMVRESMNIKQQKTELEEQFRMLFEISEMQSNDSTNSVLHTFTIFGLLFVGLQIIQQYNGQSLIGVIILMIFVVLFIRFIWYMGKHLKAPNKVEGNSKEEKDMLTFTIVCIIVLSAVYLINAFPFKDKILQWFLTLFRLK